jgi:DNA-binding PadR family transcriptional regulator
MVNLVKLRAKREELVKIMKNERYKIRKKYQITEKERNMLKKIFQNTEKESWKRKCMF